MGSRALNFALALLWIGLLCGLGPLSRDGDLYFHLATGREILATLSLPRVDHFTFTAAGTPNELHSWLGTTVLAASYQLGGEWGLRGLHGVILGALFFLAGRRWRLFPALFIAVGITVLFFVHRELADLRPFLFGELFLMAGGCWLLPAVDAQRWSRPIRLLAVLVWAALWSNLHGSGLLSPVLVALLVRKDRPRLVLAALLGTFLTPVGPDAYRLAVSLSLKAQQHQVAEWIAPHPLVWEAGALEIKMLASTLAAALTVAAIFLSEYRLASLVFLSLFLTSQRHLFLLLLPTVWGLEAVWAQTRRRWSFRGGWAALFVLVLLAQPWRWQSTVPMPERAVAFLQAAGLRGNVLPFQAWGGYLLQRTYPALRVGLDCRITQHERMANLFEELVNPDGTVDLKRVMQQLPEAQMILFPAAVPLRSILKDIGVVVWENPVATLVLRESPTNRENFERVAAYYERHHLRWDREIGFRVAAVLAENPQWWAEQQEIAAPVWEERQVAEETRREIGFYRARQIQYASGPEVDPPIRR